MGFAANIYPPMWRAHEIEILNGHMANSLAACPVTSGSLLCLLVAIGVSVTGSIINDLETAEYSLRCN